MEGGGRKGGRRETGRKRKIEGRGRKGGRRRERGRKGS